jgi:hypothetical protein
VDLDDERVTDSEAADIATTSAASDAKTAVHVFTTPPSTLREYARRPRSVSGNSRPRPGGRRLRP